MSEHLSDLGYQNPTDAKRTAWHKMSEIHDPGNSEGIFEWMAKRPEQLHDFQAFMSSYGSTKTSWIDMYPTEDLVRSARPNGVVLVDVGGGVGPDIDKFRLQHPELRQGSLILQDMPEVIGSVSVEKPITAMAHDFFKSQPIKGIWVMTHPQYLH